MRRENNIKFIPAKQCIQEYTNFIYEMRFRKERIDSISKEFYNQMETSVCRKRRWMLRIIFAQELTVEEKIKMLAEKYDFKVGNKREVDEMCNYSDYIENIGIEKGKAAGIAEGKAVGIAEGLRSLVETLKDLIPNFEMLYQRIIKNEIYADVTRDEVRRYL